MSLYILAFQKPLKPDSMLAKALNDPRAYQISDTVWFVESTKHIIDFEPWIEGFTKKYHEGDVSIISLSPILDHPRGTGIHLLSAAKKLPDSDKLEALLKSFCQTFRQQILDNEK